LHAWRQPQLVALQRQLAGTDLLPFVMEAFVDESVATPTTVEITSGPDLFKLFGERKRSLSDPVYTYLYFGPRGWLYQNLVVGAPFQQRNREIGDPARGLVLPGKAKLAAAERASLHAWSPYSFLIATAIPNFVKAWQRTARNQTQVNQALIACALEGYHLEHGDYPETLDALVPRYIEKIPHDVIDGKLMRYRRAAGGQFMLYSIGWNEQDDGGQIALDKDGNEVVENGDWVWPPK
jgi:competence protein ComGC